MRRPRDEHGGICENRGKGGGVGTPEDKSQAGESLLLLWQQNECGGPMPIERKGVAD